MKTSNNEQGGALLTVLWVSAALAAIAFSVSISIRAETDRAATAADGLRAAYLASGSVERAVQWLLWGTADGKYFNYQRYSDKPRLNFSYSSGDVVVEMMPESAKLDVNHASGDDLFRLVTAVTGDPQRARQVTGAIQGGASAAPVSLFQPPGSTLQARPASFEEIEQLLLVPGMTPELYYGNYVADADGRLSPRGGLRDSLSVWGSAGPFDANAASPALLEALGASPRAVAQLVQRRAQQPFQNLGEVAALGIPIGRLEVGGGSTVPHLIWNIRATARLRRPDGAPSEVVRSASAIARLVLPPKPRGRNRPPIQRVQVLRFYEDAWSEFAAAPPGPSGVLLQ